MLLPGTLTACTSLKHSHTPRAQATFARKSGTRLTQRLFELRIQASVPKSDVIVIGGGAAGLTAAYFAALNGAQVCALYLSLGSHEPMY